MSNLKILIVFISVRSFCTTIVNSTQINEDQTRNTAAFGREWKSPTGHVHSVPDRSSWTSWGWTRVWLLHSESCTWILSARCCSRTAAGNGWTATRPSPWNTHWTKTWSSATTTTTPRSRWTSRSGKTSLTETCTSGTWDRWTSFGKNARKPKHDLSWMPFILESHTLQHFLEDKECTLRSFRCVCEMQVPLSETECVEVEHRVAEALLHRGQHMHGALPISSGCRWNLVVWMRASRQRNRLCPMCNRAPRLQPSDGYGDGFTEEDTGLCALTWSP